MAYDVTTEWFDLQVKYKNYLPQEKKESKDVIEQMIREEAEKYDPLDKKTVDELDELEDLEDDKVLQMYKQKRINEMKEFSKNAKYGSVKEIRKHEYKEEVNEASKNATVILLLHQEYIEESRVLNKILDNMAKKFPFIKFLKIEATNCVVNFRDSDVPTIFVYKDGNLFKQFIPASYYFGGKNMNWKKVEWIFSSMGLLKTDLEEDPFDEYSFKIEKLKGKKVKRDDESDSEDEAKPNRWKI